MGDIEKNRILAKRFVEAWNNDDWELFDQILHPEMTWHTAITPPNVNEVPRLQSDLLKDFGYLWQKAIANKQDTIDTFKMTKQFVDPFQIELKRTIVEGDTMAVETLGTAVNTMNGRRYDNVYCYIIEVRDGQIYLFREYQNTLMVFDTMAAP